MDAIRLAKLKPRFLKGEDHHCGCILRRRRRVEGCGRINDQAFPVEAECLPELQLELEFPALLWFQRVLRVLRPQCEEDIRAAPFASINAPRASVRNQHPARLRSQPIVNQLTHKRARAVVVVFLNPVQLMTRST